jgi:hypothetical protein
VKRASALRIRDADLVYATANQVVATVPRVYATLNLGHATFNRRNATVLRFFVTPHRFHGSLHRCNATPNPVVATENRFNATENLLNATRNQRNATAPRFHRPFHRVVVTGYQFHETWQRSRPGVISCPAPPDLSCALPSGFPVRLRDSPVGEGRCSSVSVRDL